MHFLTVSCQCTTVRVMAWVGVCNWVWVWVSLRADWCIVRWLECSLWDQTHALQLRRYRLGLELVLELIEKKQDGQVNGQRKNFT